MELRHLRYFIAVAEEQNVTRAAVRLHVSQPPLSRQIRDLEEELGVSLFFHGAKSVRLTEEGRLFLREAQAVIQRAEDAVRAVRAMAGGTGGELIVGYAPSPTVELLPSALAAYQTAAPAVRVTLRDLSSEEQLAGLRERKLHLALLVRPSKSGLRGLIFHPLRRYAIHVAVNPLHPLAATRRITLARLASERLVGYTQKDYPEYHQWIAELLKGARAKGSASRSPLFAEEYDSATSLIAAVEAGRGVAVVPESLACFAGPRVTLRPLTPSPEPIEVGVAHLDDTLTPHATRFVEVLLEAQQKNRSDSPGLSRKKPESASGSIRRKTPPSPPIRPQG
jgi:DNA-binding transcriptional LysR family regulator